MQTKTIRALLIMICLPLLAISGCNGFHWADGAENSCWKNEAAQAFEHYKTFRTRSAILRAARDHGQDVMNPKSNPVEIIERDPNGCSLGSNGLTVVWFYFDDGNKLMTMQVFRNYRTSDPDYKMELIEERKF